MTLTRISHRNLGQDIASDSFSNTREHYPVDKARGFEDEDGVTGCPNYPRSCEKYSLIKTWMTNEGNLSLFLNQHHGTCVVAQGSSHLFEHQLSGIEKTWKKNIRVLKAALCQSYCIPTYQLGQLVHLTILPRLLGGGNNPSSESFSQDNGDRFDSGDSLGGWRYDSSQRRTSPFAVFDGTRPSNSDRVGGIIGNSRSSVIESRLNLGHSRTSRNSRSTNRSRHNLKRNTPRRRTPPSSTAHNKGSRPVQQEKPVKLLHLPKSRISATTGKKMVPAHRYPIGLHSVDSAKVVTGPGYKVEKQETPSAKPLLSMESSNFQKNTTERDENTRESTPKATQQSPAKKKWVTRPIKLGALKESKYRKGLKPKVKEEEDYHKWDHTKPLSGTNSSARESYGYVPPADPFVKEVVTTGVQTVAEETFGKAVLGKLAGPLSFFATLFEVKTLGDGIAGEQLHIQNLRQMGLIESEEKIADDQIKMEQTVTQHKLDSWEKQKIDKLTNTPKL